MDVFVERPEIYREIKNVLFDSSHNRRLCMLFGEFGIGKTTFLNKIEQDLENKLKIRFDLGRGIGLDSNALKEIFVDFIKSSGVLFAKKEKNKDIRLIDKIIGVVKDLNPSFTIETDSQGTFTGSISANYVAPLIKLIENRHESYIKTTTESSLEEFPYVLARITRDICYACENTLYIIIDDGDKLDFHVAHYLYHLLRTRTKIALLISIEQDFSSLKDQYLTTLLNEYFLKNEDTNDKSKYNLTYFNVSETCEYITKRLKRSERIEDAIAESIHNYTQGFPFILSLLCKDESNIEKICNKNTMNFNSNKYDLFYKKIMDAFDAAQKEILYILICNQMHIYQDVLKKIMYQVHSVNPITCGDLTSRLTKDNHIETVDKIIYFKNRIFADYINNNSDYLPASKKSEYYPIIIEEYKNLPDSKGKIEKYDSLSNLYIKIEEFNEAYSAICHCSELFINQKMPDKSVTFLNRVINDSTVFTNLTIEQRSNLNFKLCFSYTLCKDMDNVIKVFSSIDDEELQFMKTSSTCSELLLIMSMAYYYKNVPNEAIKYAELACNENLLDIRGIYYKAMGIISSSYDLLGNYDNSLATYTDALQKAEQNSDFADVGIFKMTVQMVHAEFDICIRFLMDAIRIFSEVTYDNRNLACSYNNIGIEYLMNGNYEKAKEFLHKAEATFASYVSIESHFTENNLGLYYLLSPEKDYDKALKYMVRAYENSISPLQHAYTSANMAIILFEKGEKHNAHTWLNTAMTHASGTPDPIVMSYVSYNFARYYMNVGNKNDAVKYFEKSRKGIDKDQLRCMKVKRERALKIAEGRSNNLPAYNFESDQRRMFFAQCEWEPCELMFYN